MDGDQGGKCEACGNTLDEQNVKLKKDKRFCSNICAKSYVIYIKDSLRFVECIQLIVILVFVIRKKKDIHLGDKQWAEMEVDAKHDNDAMKKNGEDKLLVVLPNSVDDSLPKINPVRWTVCIFRVSLG